MSVEGSSFSLSRKLNELIYFENGKSIHLDTDWCRNVGRRFEAWRKCGLSRPYTFEGSASCVPNKICRHPLSRLALAFKRSSDNKAFDAKLPQGSHRLGVEADRLSLLQICENEDIALQDRCSLAKKVNLLSLTKEKYK